ncbi:uncharacterized protein LOC105444778 [Strongylocentrotus purpuratus]|uniref:Uncharacterized protein n=1 Tax=Strongylocentrotus purpuratus TaxID=7668 RepID=A0A7M7HNR3_STRPU|nr:uncharacterized protein LOC105444778 [Strongylocentrotus purpuratus]|eukprot:XP_011677774.1 PREDICTED: uncharacterized protein LOC105444778 [Strongylocentrotus purpuratus]
MESEKIILILAVVFMYISRRVTTAQDNEDEQQSSSYSFHSVELSFWIALGLATSVILTCLCCIFCCKRKSFIGQPGGPTALEQGQGRDGQVNSALDYSCPPPPYSEAPKYALSKETDGLPDYSETYL